MDVRRDVPNGSVPFQWEEEGIVGLSVGELAKEALTFGVNTAMDSVMPTAPPPDPHR